MKTQRRPRDDVWGMTLIELVISMLIFSIIVSGALSFLAVQSRAFAFSVDRMTALSGLRYSLLTAGRDIQTMGANLAPGQPALVYAGWDVIAFNADYATNVSNDVFAVYNNPDAPTNEVTAPTAPLLIPTTSQSWPDTTYGTSGTNSQAELIIFFFQQDTSTSRTDDYQLMRQVNSSDAELVSDGLLRIGARPFFEYYKRVTPVSAAAYLDSVPASQMPMYHAEPIHLGMADTAASAKIDSVRAVRINVGSTNGQVGERERILEMSRLIHMPNAGLGLLSTCGDLPLLGAALTASYALQGPGEPSVVLSWTPATDETGGELDVVRYVLWRRLLPESDWGTPYLSIPAGEPAYQYVDSVVQPGASYIYALAAQDCTPALSNLTSSGAVTIPSSP